MYFLVFEGLDGSGKSTLMERLKTHLFKKSKQVLMTREPGGTVLGDEIREILLSTEGEIPTSRTELLLYEASRAQHVETVIRPALSSSQWVLCDRFTASSVAFQGGGRGFPQEQVEWLNYFATGGLVADLTILIDVSWDECQRRQKKREISRGQEKDRMESEAASFHESVRKSFLAQALADSDNWLVLDGNLSPDRLAEQLIADIERRKWLVS